MLPPTRSQWRSATIAAAVPFGAGVLAVLAYNYARFGHILEFGQNFQLTSVYESRMRHFSWTYMPHNLGIYFFRALEWSGVFPYLQAAVVRGGPPGYLGSWNEAVGGIAVAFPIVWLALGLPLAWRGRVGEDVIRLRGLMFAVGAYAAANGGVILAYFLATPRYAADFGPALVLIALVGLLAVERWSRGRRTEDGGRRTEDARGYAIRATIAIAGLFTLGAGVCLSFGYHDQLLRRLNPPQWESAARWLGGRGIER